MERAPGLILRRARLPKVPKWWPEECPEVVYVARGEAFVRRLVVNEDPFEGGSLHHVEEPVTDPRVLRKLDGLVRHQCAVVIRPPSAK